MSSDHRVLVITSVPDQIAPPLRQRFPDMAIHVEDDPDKVPGVLERFQPTVIFAIAGEPYPKNRFPELLTFPSVRWLSNGGAGVDHIGKWDPAAKTVTNAAGVNAPFLAQFTIAAHMSANIGMPRYAKQQRAKHWERHEWPPLTDRKFCVVGLGSIGRLVAQHAKYFGMHTVGTRGTARPTDHVDTVYGSTDLLTALDGADFVSVHCASTPETAGIINDAAFDAMADGVIFLNASRGAVVDEDALLRALNRGKIGTAILDVFRTEPLPQDSPLWDHENVIVTPHMADSISGWEVNLTRAFGDNLERWIAGAPLESLVDPARGY
ncbi:MAG: D-2-hydroxyacid dehydrogenase [Alphaproteobacteria bacterium]|nr:D-2-hydroxyacid dehydrogenase [Alphaproteobacteria bacterium]